MSDVTLRPVRFTDDVGAARAFFELLGLAPRVASDDGGWVDLVAGAGGMVAVHAAPTSETQQPAGRTTYSAECTDADALAESLRANGFDDAVVYDEAYGRVLVVTDPDGRQVQLDERSSDLHGYQRQDPSGADPRWRVRAEVVTPDVDRYRRFVEVLGLADLTDVVPGDRTTAPAVGPDGAPREALASRLVLVTEEPLDLVVQRLRAAGHADADEGDDDALTVRDPDGATVVVRAGQLAGQLAGQPGADRG
ncbi:hypothetical protein GCM10027446_26310 [Angustibacter peucedani]